MLYWGGVEDKLSTSIKLGKRFFEIFWKFYRFVDARDCVFY